jgi:hypothetical protein
MKVKKLFKLSNRYPVRLLILYSLTLLCAAGYSNSRAAEPISNAAIAEFEPALATRASGCITCHAKIDSNYITDFGYGDSYFFGNPRGKSTPGSFNGNIYGDFFGAEPNKTAWLTAEMNKEIIVPQARFDFDLSIAAPAKLAKQPSCQQALHANSLAKYLEAVENQKTNPAPVIEKKEVFIGAPGAATLESRFNINSASETNFKYLKDSSGISPDIAGIDLSSSKDYYTNSGEVVCDGDLFIRGTLFLNHAIIATTNGCRIYATGPIFLQHTVDFKSLSGAPDKTNLQLVSSVAILLGFGDKNCAAKAEASPLSTRLLASYALSSFVTRDANNKSISPKTVSQNIYDQAKLIPSLEDASCHDDTTGFSRILLNAPQIHSRYKGRFKGLVVAEFALFRPGKASLEFDAVFKEVPVLPLLKDSDYLIVK